MSPELRKEIHALRKIQALATTAVNKAVKLGHLPHPSTLSCVDCGTTEKRMVYDHRDYSKPLEVAAVCNQCNLLRGPALGHKTFKSERAKLSRRSKGLPKVQVVKA